MAELEKETDDVMKKFQNLCVKEEDVEKEFKKDFASRLRLKKGALFIREIGNKVHCNLLTVTRAMVLFHKVRKNPLFNDSCLAPVACLNLCIKLCDEEVTPDEIVLKSYHVIMDFETSPIPNRRNPSAIVLWNMKRHLVSAEYAISGSMSFKLECPIAHPLVYRTLDYIQKSIPNLSPGLMLAVSSTVTKLLGTYYLCEGCLDFNAEEIAWGSLQFANLCFGVCSKPMEKILETGFASQPNKDRVSDVLEELMLVSDVSTTLKYI